MIDRIRPSDNLPAAYERSGNKAARVEGDAPAFLLPGEENGGVIWERGKDDTRAVAGKKREEHIPTKKKDSPPVVWEKSGIEKPREEKSREEKPAGPGLLSRLGDLFKELLARLWYGDDRPEDKKPENAAVAADREGRIRTSIANKDTEALIEELTEGGKLKPARNTSLLTHYDRFGRIVKLEDTDVGRILRGERTTTRHNVVMRPQGNYRRYV
ncbi:MAG: hypothetical protein IK115_05670 [Lachnospiraceae bacterium]|nr:hypothetical protein [Lachnospiraceae bacterium]